MALHFEWNFVLGPVFGSQVNGCETGSILQIKITVNQLLTSGNFGFEASLILTLFMIIFISGLEIYYQYLQPIMISKKRNSSNQQELSCYLRE
jgi:uncharacterized protein